MENHIPQAVINRAELFFESKTKYSIILLGEYKNKTAYYVSYGLLTKKEAVAHQS